MTENGTRTWTRALGRRRRALYISSPIGLGHAQRDVGIADELRKLHPDLEIDWLAQHPVTAVLEERGEALQAANRELAIQSLTDPLTGAANRRQLMTALRAAPANCALLVIDVDHFKSYNDAFGHSEGDTCLVLVAEALRRSARQRIDVVARQGGEEFAMLLPHAGEQVALEIAERARRNVEALLETRPNMLRRRVTVSVGVAVLWVRNGDILKAPERLLAAADDALYRAKRNGRNRVEVAAP